MVEEVFPNTRISCILWHWYRFIVLQTQICYIYSSMYQQLTWVYIHGLGVFIRPYIYYEEELYQSISLAENQTDINMLTQIMNRMFFVAFKYNKTYFEWCVIVKNTIVISFFSCAGWSHEDSHPPSCSVIGTFISIHSILSIWLHIKATYSCEAINICLLFLESEYKKLTLISEETIPNITDIIHCQSYELKRCCRFIVYI